MLDVKVPNLGESVTTATVAEWLKKEGEFVKRDEPIVVLETDKVSVEVPAPDSGRLIKCCVRTDQEVQVGHLVAQIDTDAQGVDSKQKMSSPQKPALKNYSDGKERILPAARKLALEKNIDYKAIGPGSGLGGRITKEDVMNYMKAPPESKQSVKSGPILDSHRQLREGEERVPMTRLRRTIARRLKESQERAAMLTTFNEVDMSAAMALRKKYQEFFIKKYGIKLGYMSIFSKAVIGALQEFPTINAEINGDDIIYRHFVNLGIAVGGDKGLVVPVLHNVQDMSFAQIEQNIAHLAKAARSGKLKLDQLTGGTFSITNGGIYGSLLSTPILNPPQSGILGMHAIVQRPVAVDSEVVIRPMMYIALSYDHRIVDGKEAVSFLVRVKKNIEDPARMLIEV